MKLNAVEMDTMAFTSFTTQTTAPLPAKTYMWRLTSFR